MLFDKDNSQNKLSTLVRDPAPTAALFCAHGGVQDGGGRGPDIGRRRCGM